LILEPALDSQTRKRLHRPAPPRNRSSMLRSAYPPGGDPLDFPDTPQGACGPAKTATPTFRLRSWISGDPTGGRGPSGKSNHFSKGPSTGLRVLRCSCRASDREISQDSSAKHSPSG
jgi:hypothetical protein